MSESLRSRVFVGLLRILGTSFARPSHVPPFVTPWGVEYATVPARRGLAEPWRVLHFGRWTSVAADRGSVTAATKDAGLLRRRGYGKGKARLLLICSTN